MNSSKFAFSFLAFSFALRLELAFLAKTFLTFSFAFLAFESFPATGLGCVARTAADTAAVLAKGCTL